MRVIVDLMGGDRAPGETLRGVVAAAAESNASYLLVGDRDEIFRIAGEIGADLRRFDIVHAPGVVTMEDPPLSVMREKSDSSMAVGLHLLAQGQGDVFVSTGNTGALFTGATLIVRKIRGVQRAGIGTLLPTDEPCLLLDSGASVTVDAETLCQFAVMGSAYVRHLFGIQAPRVGLLNNGTEACKGTPLQREANGRLSALPGICYAGNVEAVAVPFGACHVLVTDGFTGNVFLKCMEGTGRFLLRSVKELFAGGPLSRMSALLVKNRAKELKRRFDPAEHGGAPLLGISKPVVKAHGSSDARAFRMAIRAAVNYAQSDAVYEMARAVNEFDAAKRAAKAAVAGETGAKE